MNEYSKYYDILVDLRSLLFAGKEFDAKYVEILGNRYKNKITESSKKEKDEIFNNLINRAKSDFIELPVSGIQFSEVKELMDLVKTINEQFIISEQSERYSASKESFDKLNRQFRKCIYVAGDIKAAVAVFEKEAKAWENKDQKYKLFEILRKYAKLCETLLLNATDNNTQWLLSPDLVDVVLSINSDINKNDFTPFKYKELSERYVLERSLQNVPEEKRFPLIITLISLKCKTLKIELPSISSISTCPTCGEKVPTGNRCAKCKAYIKCPGCKQPIVKNAKICGGCGIEITDIEIWENKIKEAAKTVSSGDYKSAELLINPIKIKWVKNKEIALVTNAIAELRTKTTACVSAVSKCIENRNYFAAKKHIDEIKHIAVLDDTLKTQEKEIHNKIGQARTLIDTAYKQSNSIQETDTYAQAISLVSDFEEAINKLKSQNLVVANLVCKANGKQVQLSWDKINSNSLAVKYIVYREDTDSKAKTEITQTSSTVFTDTINGGTSYFYYIQAQYIVNGTDILGVWDEVKSQEVLVADEVVDYKVTVGDKRVRIEFTPNPKAVDYELYKASGSGEKDILKANLRTGNFTDTEVQNGVRYAYTLVAIFKKNSGEIVRSQGVEMYATPLVPPEPVQQLDFSKENEIVMLSWNGHGKSNDGFRILHSANPINKPIGFSMSLVDLEKSGKIITPTTSSKTECILFDHVVKNYFSVWSVFGDIVIAGAEIDVLNVTEVSNAKAYISSGKLYVEWNWPSNCKQVRISYSNESHTDVHKIEKNYPRELYDRQKAFVIEPVLNKDYYIEIATQNFEGQQEMLSSGVRLKLANSNPMTIKYTIKASTFLGKKLTLTIENDNNEYLPELVLVSAAGRMPTRKEDGTAIHIISAGTSCGTFKLGNEHIRKNYYARLFLSDTSIKNVKIITPDKERLKLY